MDPGCPPGAGPRLLPFLYLPTALLCVHLGPLVATRRPLGPGCHGNSYCLKQDFASAWRGDLSTPAPRVSRARPVVGGGLWGQHRAGSGDP